MKLNFEKKKVQYSFIGLCKQKFNTKTCKLIKTYTATFKWTHDYPVE